MSYDKCQEGLVNEMDGGMGDESLDFSADVSGLERPAWSARIDEIAEAHGFAEHLGGGHRALFVDRGPVLLVCFETVPHVRRVNEGVVPLGYGFTATLGWSSLTLLAENESWFREDGIYAFFDRLIDDGFFDAFERVLFYGAGACGYAAAAYSVCAPEAHVLALRPQATLSPRLAGWDRRFIAQRRQDFTSRFGYAPDMTETAARVWIVYDPWQTEDAMHAALFRARNVTLYRAPGLGNAIEKDFARMEVLSDMVEMAMEGTLDAPAFAELWRERRDHVPYLRTLLHRLEDKGRPTMIARVCRHATRKQRRPLFLRKLEELGVAEPEER